MVVGATAILSGFVLFSAPALWSEFQGLRRDWEVSRLGVPLAFVDISPNPSYAEPPAQWTRQEGDSLLLWAGWKHNIGHGWFKVGTGDLDVAHLHLPMGRDVVRAIDRPIVEVGEGEHWENMQPETPVVGVKTAGVVTAYPLLLLEKVEVVNDTVGDQAVLVVFTPFVPRDEAVDVFDPTHDGRRLTFGSSGHFHGPQRRPLLYDRQTESLWAVDDDGIGCVGGACKGARLRRLDHPKPTDWGTWSARHAGARLIVGADRPRTRKAAPPRPL
jgi:hypothetical protein